MTADVMRSVTRQATKRKTVAKPAEMRVDSRGKTQKSQLLDVSDTGIFPACWPGNVTWQKFVSSLSKVAKKV